MEQPDTSSPAPLPLAQRSRRRRLEFLLSIGAVVALTVATSEVARPTPSHGASRLVDLRAIPESILKREAVVALDVNEEELEEIYRNWERRGRRWERVGAVAFLREGELVFESPVGVRVHGDGSRSSPDRSLRLHFRSSLKAKLPESAAIGLPAGRQLDRLVLHGDIRRDTGGRAYHYVSPLGYDIARRLGVLAAETFPATLVVNHGKPRPIVLTEHLNVDFLQSRFGHRDFRMYDTKDYVNDLGQLAIVGPLAELRALYGKQENWTLERIGKHVDLDNLARWFLVISFCGTRDELQGILAHDDSHPEGKWFWIAWDMDHSFGRRDREWSPRWEVDQFQRLLVDDPRYNERFYGDARVVLLRHLFTTSAPFRESFARMWLTARDSLLTPAFLEERLSFYERSAAAHGIVDVQYQRDVREFLTHRPEALHKQIGRFLQYPVQ